MNNYRYYTKRLNTILIIGSFVFTLSWLGGSCRKTDLSRIYLETPAGFPPPAYSLNENPFTWEGFELGKKLFYDGRLSIDGKHPCSSCHQQNAAFGTYQHDRSHGVYESHTLRNAPVLFNLAWNNSFHWDGEFRSVEDEAAQPITGHIEMGETFKGVIGKLQNDPDYKRRFKNVFRNQMIEPAHIQKALAQFTGYMVSANSKFDRYKKGLVIFTAQEESGYILFKSNCASCHPEPLFTDNSYRNIGLPIDSLLNDYGRKRLTGRKEDSLKFKVPTLRNVYVSANYMHDGRFNTLAQVINHYRSGVKQSATLDPQLANGIPLNTTEAEAIAVFLRTLTDSSFISDPRFSY